ncbi:MAG: CZB domain-containing protein [Chromatiales bacterium]|jgi:methyl-accepting chemotaxis protein
MSPISRTRHAIEIIETAIVADEVKALASKTSKATGEIESVTETMNELSDQIGLSAENSLNRLTPSVDALEEVAVALAESSEGVEGLVEDARVSAQSVEAVFRPLAEWNENASLLVQVVKSDHMLWRARLADAVLGGEPIDEEDIKDSRRCRLGSWYYGAGRRLFGDDPTYQALEAPHEAVHLKGHEVLQLLAEGRHEAAERCYSELNELTEQIFWLLDRLTARR